MGIIRHVSVDVSTLHCAAYASPEPQSVNILFASSEAVPFAKTGGLADVVEALPRKLEKLGHHPIVFLPAYRHARECGQPMEPTNIAVAVRVGSKDVRGRLLRSRLPDSTPS